jgi:hypothetical protein
MLLQENKMIDIKEIAQNRYVQLVIVGLTCFGMAFLFKPSTTTETEVIEKHEQEIERLNVEIASLLKSHVEIVAEKESEFKKLQVETEKTVKSLKSENSSLKQKIKTRIVKIIKPDGTIVEESVSESDTESTSLIITQVQEEFKQKITEVEERWKSIHEQRVSTLQQNYEKKEQEYQKTIDELHSKTVVKVNEKKLGLEAGYTVKKSIYGHMTYDFANPFFLGGTIEKEKEQYDFGLGFGVRL